MPKIVDHSERRAELSAVAAQVIAARGLEAATIREIAQASGYSKGVVEHYFDDKEQLISAALDSANHRYEVRATKATAGLQGLAALRQRILATLPMTSAERDEWKVRLVFWSLAAIQPQLRQRQRRRFGRAIMSFEQDIKVAVQAGELSVGSDTQVQARRIVNMTTGISAAALHNPGFYSRALLTAEADYLITQIKRESPV
ncbi:TetR family transcriptional regulator [Halieaceae bacterium IMCC14734]|uniref:TetR family transcriptional regulator n=1 Tax=Candidatus Litorirhabdus singularis TaxID=2518993 RepID=A0ABT3TBW4_9GAMM|nr:TetR family transcriptional regulator C-terminal domain-containing protein [Candidatus Litorirhabdus singularis]MCX2979665.1 TetR family transcriptional regulator [Candidatus Litorirhabdus singularis]